MKELGTTASQMHHLGINLHSLKKLKTAILQKSKWETKKVSF